MERGLHGGVQPGDEAKIVWIYVGSLVGAVLLIVAIVLIMDAIGGSGCQGKKRRQEAPTAVRSSRLALGGEEMPPLAPLTWSDAEGAFMIQLSIGSGQVYLVLDTGSSQVSAKVDGCEWTQCPESGDCSVQACPCDKGDCTLEYYRPSHASSALVNAGTYGYSTTMKYGSQEDTVSHAVDRVTIPKVAATCNQLLSGGAARFSRGRMDEGVSADMVIHKVHRIKGTSTSNMFGLARPELAGGDSKQPAAVLDKLFDGTSQKVWSLLLYYKTGWWALGRIPCFAPTYVPLVQPRAFSQFVTKFYVLPVIAIEAGPTVELMRPIASSKCPKYCVVDTGTTYTYGSERLGSSLDKLGYDERTWFVRFVLGEGKQVVELLFTPEQLRDPDIPGSSVLQCWTGRTLDGFDGMFSGANVLLWGAYMMRNMYWEFDVGRHRVGVAPL